jgi:hypothetical protein
MAVRSTNCFKISIRKTFMQQAALLYLAQIEINDAELMVNSTNSVCCKEERSEVLERIKETAVYLAMIFPPDIIATNASLSLRLTGISCFSIFTTKPSMAVMAFIFTIYDRCMR